MTYEGCHVFNPGRFLGRSLGFSTYTPALRESEAWYVIFSTYPSSSSPPPVVQPVLKISVTFCISFPASWNWKPRIDDTREIGFKVEHIPSVGICSHNLYSSMFVI